MVTVVSHIGDKRGIHMKLFAAKNEYLQGEMFSSLFLLRAIAVGLPDINLLIINLIVGRYIGTEGLAAMGFMAPISNIAGAFIGLIGSGIQIACGRKLGKGDADGIKTAFSTGIFSASAIGLILALSAFMFSGQIAGAFGAEGELWEMAVDYLRGFVPSLLLMIPGSGFLFCLQMDNANKLSVFAIEMQIISSTLLSLIFTRVFCLGMFGIGLAISSGNLLLVLICCLHFGKSRLFRLSIKSIQWDCLKEIFSFGANSSLVNIWLFIRTTLFNRVVFALSGAVAMSAMTVANNITGAICCTIEGGMAGSTATIASVLVGERNVKGLRRLHKTAAAYTYPIAIAAYALIFVLAAPISRLFGAEAESISVYVTVIRLFNLWMLINPLKAPVIWIYNAIGNTKLPRVFCFVFMLWGSVAVIAVGWLCRSLEFMTLISFICDAMMYIGFVLYYICKAHRLPKGIFKVNYIPRDFSVPKEDTFVFAVRSKKEAAEGAALLTDFCRAHGMDERLGRNCGLCFEEISLGTVSRFPPNGRKEYKLEASGFFEKGHLSLTFVDNLPAFDPQRAIELYHPEDPDEGICFKIVSSLAEEMSYNFTLGMNTLTVKL